MSDSIVLKIITAGDGGVGKTTLLKRYVEGEFSAETIMTLGVQFFVKQLDIGSTEAQLQLWDFGGQEQFRHILEKYAYGAKGAIIMFDLTRLVTLETLEEWVNICRKNNPNLPIILVGSKSDLVDDIIIADDYIEEFMENFDFFTYLKSSSKTGENVEQIFEHS